MTPASADQLKSPKPTIFSSIDQAVFLLCAASFIVASIIYLAFADRQIVFDEVGLQNPIYMYFHWGRMVYPVHGRFDDMVIHPPTHYLVVAWLMRLGFGLFHAAAIVPCLLVITLCILLYRSTYPFFTKISIVTGVFLGALVWNETFTIRPDVELALSWITGLVAMECSRQANWDHSRLFLGSLLLAYASSVHYPGFLAGTAIPFYMAWMLLTLPSKRAMRAIIVAAAGTAVVAVPYILLFVIPFRQEIVDAVFAHQGRISGWFDALKIHRQSYEVWRQAEPYRASTQPLIQNLLSPLWNYRIPAAFVAPPLLAIFPRTRVLAITCLPQVLFITLLARHKQIGYSGYFAPEIVIYLIGVFVVASGLVALAARRLDQKLTKTAAWILALILTGVALQEHPIVYGGKLKLTPELDDLDLSRAVSRNLVGPGAFVGATGAGVWYTGGGDHFYMMGPDILYPHSIANLDLKTYFGHFSSIVIDNDQSWITWNQERINVTSEYIKGDLNLKAFWFADRRLASESSLSLMMLGAQKDGPVKGFATEGKRLYRFSEAAGGNWLYYAAVCPRTDLNNTGQYSFFSTFFLPSVNNDDPRGMADARPVIRTVLIPKEQFARDIAPQSSACTVRTEVPGKLVEESRSAMISELKRSDARITFYRSLPAALAMAGHVQPESMDAIGAVGMDRLRAASQGINITRQDGTVQFRTLRTLRSDAAYLPINVDPIEGEEYLYIEGAVRRGRISVSIRNTATNSILGDEVIWGDQDGVTAISIPLHAPGGDEVVIRNAESGTAGSVVLKRVVILRPRAVTAIAACTTHK